MRHCIVFVSFFSFQLFHIYLHKIGNIYFIESKACKIYIYKYNSIANIVISIIVEQLYYLNWLRTDSKNA